jgi:hypothetical protein
MSDTAHPPAPITPLLVKAAQATSIPRIGLRPRDAAIALGIGQRKLWELTNCGVLPCVRLGRTVIYPVAMLEEYLRKNATGGKGHE